MAGEAALSASTLRYVTGGNTHLRTLSVSFFLKWSPHPYNIHKAIMIYRHFWSTHKKLFHYVYATQAHSQPKQNIIT